MGIATTLFLYSSYCSGRKKREKSGESWGGVVLDEKMGNYGMFHFSKGVVARAKL